MTRVYAFLVIGAFGSFHLFGASVLIDQIRLSGDSQSYYQLEWYNSQICPSVLFSSMTSGESTTLSASGSAVRFMGLWAQGVYGDLIDQQFFDGLDSVFLNSQPWTSFPESTITVAGNQNIYLALLTNEYELDLANPYYYSPTASYYGWVELNVNRGSVTLIGSYLDLEGGGVYAGRYESSSIPEPSGAFLFLLGVGILGLRRERH